MPGTFQEQQGDLSSRWQWSKGMNSRSYSPGGTGSDRCQIMVIQAIVKTSAYSDSDSP